MSLDAGKIVVIGGGGHAKVLMSVLKRLPYEVVGYTDPNDGGPVLGVHRLGDDQVLAGLAQDHQGLRCAMGLGKTDASAGRMRFLDAACALGFDFPLIASPHAVVNEEVVLGAGTVVLDGTVVNSGTVTGRLCILNTNSTVEHDCRLGDNVHIAPGATVCGGVSIAENCMIGAGSTVVQGVTIGADCLIGAGSTVIGDITGPGTYVGHPARRVG